MRLLDISLEKLILSFVIILGLVFVFLVPPFQKPDEDDHFRRAVALSEGQFFCTNSSNSNYFSIPKSYSDLPIIMETRNIAFQYFVKFPKNLIGNEIHQTLDKTPEKILHWCGLPFVGYVPSAVAIFISSPFNIPILGFYLGRVFNFLIFVLCLVTALKIAPKYKAILFLYATIPILLHQVTAISYDALQFSLIPLIAAQLFNFMEKEKISLRHFLQFNTLTFLFVLIKPGYYPFLLLYFLIPYNKLGIKFIKYLVFTVGFFSIAGLIIYLISKKTFLLPDSLIYYNYANPIYQKSYIINHPFSFFLTFLYSLWLSVETIIKQLGSFGWLDYSTNFLVLLAYIILLFFFIKLLDFKKLKKIGLFGITLLSIILFFTTFLIFLSLYLVNSPPYASTISGVQGRYLLPLIPFFIYILAQIYLSLGKKVIQILILVVLLTYIFLNIISNIYLRYFDYTRSFVSETELTDKIKETKEITSLDTFIVDKEFKETVPIKINKKIGGFEFYTHNNKPVNVAYRYFVKDGECKNSLKSGYLDLSKLQDSNIYAVYFGPLKERSGIFGSLVTSEKKLCIVLEPISQQGLNNYFTISKIQGQFFYFLFIK